MSTETQKFAQWFEQEKADNGLVDIKFFMGDMNEANSEHVFSEANAMNESEVVAVDGRSDNVSRYKLSDVLPKSV